MDLANTAVANPPEPSPAANMEGSWPFLPNGASCFDLLEATVRDRRSFPLSLQVQSPVTDVIDDTRQLYPAKNIFRMYVL